MSFITSVQLPSWFKLPQLSPSPQQPGALPPPPPPAPAPEPEPVTPVTPLTPLQRNTKQLTLFLSGAAFLSLSVLVTRRSVLRRQLESFPKFYTTNRNLPRLDASDRQLLALQAFGLASLNVVSFAVLLVGGLAWGFDLCSVTELRARTQERLRREAGGEVSSEDEKALEEMVEDVLQKLGIDRSAWDEERKREEKKKAKLLDNATDNTS